MESDLTETKIAIATEHYKTRETVINYVLYGALFLIFASQFALQYLEKTQAEGRTEYALKRVVEENNRLGRLIHHDVNNDHDKIIRLIEQFGCKCKSNP